jgi:hypothetical protein
VRGPAFKGGGAEALGGRGGKEPGGSGQLLTYLPLKGSWQARPASCDMIALSVVLMVMLSTVRPWRRSQAMPAHDSARLPIACYLLTAVTIHKRMT